MLALIAPLMWTLSEPPIRMPISYVFAKFVNMGNLGR